MSEILSDEMKSLKELLDRFKGWRLQGCKAEQLLLELMQFSSEPALGTVSIVGWLLCYSGTLGPYSEGTKRALCADPVPHPTRMAGASSALWTHDVHNCYPYRQLPDPSAAANSG